MDEKVEGSAREDVVDSPLQYALVVDSCGRLKFSQFVQAVRNCEQGDWVPGKLSASLLGLLAKIKV